MKIEKNEKHDDLVNLNKAGLFEGSFSWEGGGAI